MKLESNRDYFDVASIVALSSGLVGGAIALVRTSGVGSLKAVLALSGKETIKERVATRVLLRDSGGLPIDDAIVIYYPEGSSFTGEEMVEYSIHSNPFIVERLVGVLLGQFGFSNALAGEFSFRAVRNGKLSLFQADAILDIISSENQTALSHSLEKAKGVRGKQIESLDVALEHLLILTEAGIDFSDQNIDEVSLSALHERLRGIREILFGLLDGYQRGSRIQNGIDTTIVGVPNAGKSSFFNLLLGEDRAIVTEIPGTTRDVLREKLLVRDRESGKSLTLVLRDTAGLRKTVDRVEELGIARSLKSMDEADLVICVIDPTQDVISQRSELIDDLLRHQNKVKLVFSKADVVSKENRNKAEEVFKGFDFFWISSVTKEGIISFEASVFHHCEKWMQRTSGEVYLTRIEQEEAVRKAIDQIDEMSGISDLDIFASEVRRIGATLSCISGKRVTDDILSGIFSKFCIGK